MRRHRREQLKGYRFPVLETQIKRGRLRSRSTSTPSVFWKAGKGARQKCGEVGKTEQRLGEAPGASPSDFAYSFPSLARIRCAGGAQHQRAALAGLSVAVVGRAGVGGLLGRFLCSRAPNA